jgi:hypothetical protein
MLGLRMHITRFTRRRPALRRGLLPCGAGARLSDLYPKGTRPRKAHASEPLYACPRVFLQAELVSLGDLVELYGCLIIDGWLRGDVR